MAAKFSAILLDPLKFNYRDNNNTIPEDAPLAIFFNGKDPTSAYVGHSIAAKYFKDSDDDILGAFTENNPFQKVSGYFPADAQVESIPVTKDELLAKMQDNNVDLNKAATALLKVKLAERKL